MLNKSRMDGLMLKDGISYLGMSMLRMLNYSNVFDSDNI